MPFNVSNDTLLTALICLISSVITVVSCFYILKMSNDQVDAMINTDAGQANKEKAPESKEEETPAVPKDDQSETPEQNQDQNGQGSNNGGNANNNDNNQQEAPKADDQGK